LAEGVVENLASLFAQHHQVGGLRQGHWAIAGAWRTNEGLVLQGWRQLIGALDARSHPVQDCKWWTPALARDFAQIPVRVGAIGLAATLRDVARFRSERQVASRFLASAQRTPRAALIGSSMSVSAPPSS
jgi:uncharacterized caspase-like protein